MPGYDPKRTRPAREDDSGSDAPIDALLTPIEAPPEPQLEQEHATQVDSVVDLRSADVPAVAAPAEDVPAPVLNVPPPDSSTGRVAVIAGMAAATVVAILLVRRMRRRH
jgi:hypothetical protein